MVKYYCKREVGEHSPPIPSLSVSLRPSRPLPSRLLPSLRPPENQLGGLRERCKLPQWGQGQSTFWCILSSKIAPVCNIFYKRPKKTVVGLSAAVSPIRLPLRHFGRGAENARLENNGPMNRLPLTAVCVRDNRCHHTNNVTEVYHFSLRRRIQVRRPRFRHGRPSPSRI